MTTKHERELFKELDRAMEMEGRRINKFVDIARKEPKAFISHVWKVLSRVTKAEYHGYMKMVKGMAEAIPDMEKEANSLRYSSKGASVYLHWRLTARAYFTIAEAAGIDEDVLVQLIQKRAEELYPPRKKMDPGKNGYTYTPPENYNAPNDLNAKRFQTATEWEWDYGEITVVEQKANKKKKRPYIESTMKLGLEELRELGYKNITRLEGYAIFTGIASQMAGNQADSIDTIYRAMGGKGKAPDDIREAIRLGVIKGMSTPITIDAKGICKWQGYKGKDNYVIDTILPARIEKRGYLNGAEVEDLIVYKGESPFVRVARAKGNQFITYDAALLDVPFKKNVNNILIPPYLLQHIEDSAHAPKLGKVIDIDKAITTLEYMGDRIRFVDYVLRCFKHWKGAGYIKNYDVEKDGRGKVLKVKYSKPSRKIAKG